MYIHTCESHHSSTKHRVYQWRYPGVSTACVTDSVPAAFQEDFPSLTLPETNFTCESKVSGGHYADPETDCRMFHICVMGPDKT